jgi:hypothetical protein
MSGTITLLCWVIDTATKQIVRVEVGHDAIWGKEKKKIEFNDIDVVMLNSQSQRPQSVVPNVSS